MSVNSHFEIDEEAVRFGPVAANLGFQLHWADVAAMADLARRLAPLAITAARATAAIYIGRNAGCDQIALGRALGINRASTMKTVDDLAARGLVERRPGRDRRSNALHLTPSGEALQGDVEAVMVAHDVNFFAALTPGERATLANLLARVRAAAHMVPNESQAA